MPPHDHNLISPTGQRVRPGSLPADPVPMWLHFRAAGKPYRSVTRHWGGLITIWRGGLAHEYRATLSSYRRMRRLLVAESQL